MTTEALIQKVREELGTLDENGERVLKTTLQILQESADNPIASSPTLNFVSQNISMVQFRKLDRDGRRRYLSDAEKMNRHWIERQFKRLGATWLMVIDGQVIKHGATLRSYPGDEGIRQIQQTSGKCPFVFISDFSWP